MSDPSLSGWSPMAEGIRTWCGDDGEWAVCPFGDYDLATSSRAVSVRIIASHIKRVHPGVEA